MRYAIIENNKVKNIIVIEPDVAEQLFPEAIRITDTTNGAYIGTRFNGAKFEPNQPYPSWVWNEETFDYDPPKPKPEGDYYWSEAEGDWVEIPEETKTTEEEK